jgi:hypothetical protein
MGRPAMAKELALLASPLLLSSSSGHPFAQSRYMGATAGSYRQSLISRTAGMAIDGTQLAPTMPTTTHKLKELYLAVDGKATDRTGSWNTQYRVLRDSFGRLDTPGVWGWNSC